MHFCSLWLESCLYPWWRECSCEIFLDSSLFEGLKQCFIVCSWEVKILDIGLTEDVLQQQTFLWDNYTISLDTFLFLLHPIYSSVFVGFVGENMSKSLVVDKSPAKIQGEIFQMFSVLLSLFEGGCLNHCSSPSHHPIEYIKMRNMLCVECEWERGNSNFVSRVVLLAFRKFPAQTNASFRFNLAETRHKELND